MRREKREEKEWNLQTCYRGQRSHYTCQLMTSGTRLSALDKEGAENQFCTFVHKGVVVAMTPGSCPWDERERREELKDWGGEAWWRRVSRTVYTTLKMVTLAQLDYKDEGEGGCCENLTIVSCRHLVRMFKFVFVCCSALGAIILAELSCYRCQMIGVLNCTLNILPHSLELDFALKKCLWSQLCCSVRKNNLWTRLCGENILQQHDDSL